LANIAVVLKEEISRLARKEVKGQTQKLQKAVAQYRKDIAALKRQTAELRSKMVYATRLMRSSAPGQVSETKSQGIRITAKGIRSHRSLLGFSAADYGALVGVTGHTIYKWEQGENRPRQRQLTALASVRGLRKREAVARLTELRIGAATAKKKKR
jgi:DNA-binding transcriptional regulator YiaG